MVRLHKVKLCQNFSKFQFLTKLHLTGVVRFTASWWSTCGQARHPACPGDRYNNVIDTPGGERSTTPTCSEVEGCIGCYILDYSISKISQT